MTAKEYCMNHPVIAYASRNAGLEIHGIEYGINDYAVVENVGLCPIDYNPEYPLNTKVIINNVYYALDGFMKVQ